jgi:hypothetical protein
VREFFWRAWKAQGFRRSSNIFVCSQRAFLKLTQKQLPPHQAALTLQHGHRTRVKENKYAIVPNLPPKKYGPRYYTLSRYRTLVLGQFVYY